MLRTSNMLNRTSTVGVMNATRMLALGLTAIAFAIGCSVDSDLPGNNQPTGSVGGGGGEGGSVGVGGGGGQGLSLGAGEGGGGSGSGSGSGGGGAGGPLFTDPLGGIGMMAEPYSPCVPHGGVSVELYAAAPETPTFDTLAHVANRRLAGGPSGFATFGMDGSAPTSSLLVPFESTLVASEGNSIGAVGLSSGSVLFQRYLADETPVGNATTIASGMMSALAIGGGGGSSLVLLRDGGVIRARRVSPSGVLWPLWPLTLDSAWPLTDMTARVVGGGDSYAAVWSGKRSDGQFSSWFIQVKATGAHGSPFNMTASAAEHWVSGFVSTTKGYAMLYSGGNPPSAAYLVTQDDMGGAAGQGWKLGGAAYGLGLASNNGALGVLVKRDSGELAFRRYHDWTGAPLGPWVCLDGPSSDSSDMAAIDADGAGWAIVYRTPQGAVRLLRIDADGTGAP